MKRPRALGLAWLAAGAMALAGWIYGGQIAGYFALQQRLHADEAARSAQPVITLADSCTPCHGAGGRSRAAAYPALAGQSAAYLADQLDRLADGRRPSPIMGSMAQSLGAPDRAALARWFAAQPPWPALAGPLAPALRPCAGCHGAALQGERDVPRLAGMGRIYVARQLLAYRSGTRIDPGGAMNAVAQALDEPQIAAITRSLPLPAGH